MPAVLSPAAIVSASAATIVIADDHPLFRSALRAAVTQALPGAAVFEADGLAALLASVEAHPDADLVLLDLRMPGVRGFSSLIELRALHPAVPVAIVSAEEEPATMRRALDFGAAGFIPKSAGIEKIGAALRAILGGDVWLPAGVDAAAAHDEEAERALAQRVASLTPQQFRVLIMLADGRLNKQIAYDLDVAEATIKAHVTAILRKLGLYRRTQAAVLAQRLLLAEGGTMLPPAADEAGEDD